MALRAHPRPGGVRALAVEPGLGRRARPGTRPRPTRRWARAAPRSRRRAARAARRTPCRSPLNSSRDLLALVEREGHVVAGRRRVGGAAPRPGGAAPRGRPSCRPSRARAARRRRRRGTSLPVGGHGVEVTAEHDPAVAAERRARDHVVADPVDGERRRARRAGAPRRGRRARPRGGSPTAPRPARR